MGLDMYLYKETHVENDSYQKPEEKYKITIKKNNKTIKSIKTKRISYIIEEVAYWRKANQIHNWFLENLDGFQDNGNKVYVYFSDLQKLLDTVDTVLEHSKLVKGKIKNGESLKNKKWIPNMEDGKYIKDSKKAIELLPTQEGFFFGSTDYDQYYYEDLIYTQKMLTAELKEDDDATYYYSANW